MTSKKGHILIIYYCDMAIDLARELTGESVKSFGEYFEIFGIEGKIINQGKTNIIRDLKLA